MSFWEQPFRMIQPNLRNIDARTLDVPRLVDRIRQTGANSILANGGGIVAWYPTALTHQARNPYLDYDFVGAIVDEAHKYGMKVLVRMDVSKKDEATAREHPDWFQQAADGSMKRGWQMPLTCFNRPYWQVHNFEIVDELLQRYPLDGFFYNHWHYDRCYCPQCRAAFSEATGYDLPTKTDYDDPVWRRFVQFRYDELAAYTARLKAFIKQRNPQAILTVDTRVTNDQPEGLRENGWWTPAMAGATDIITVEAFNILTRPLPKWIYWAGEEVKVGTQMRPTSVILTYSEIFGSRRSGQPPAQLGYDLMQIAAHGGSPCMAFSGTYEQDDRKAIPIIDEVYQHLERHADYYHSYQSTAAIGIVYSQTTADFYGRGDSFNRYLHHYRGVYAALNEEHIQFDVLHEGILTPEVLQRYRLIYLPNVACMSAAQAEMLDAYVQSGGHIIATAETSLYDEQGQPREQPALRCLGSTIVERRAVPGSYLSIRHNQRFPTLAETDVIALDGEMLVTQPSGTADEQHTELFFIPSVLNNTPEFAFWEEVGNDAGLITNRTGSGSAHYLPWAIDKFYHMYGVPEYRTILTQLAVECGIEREVQTNAPASVEVTLYRQSGNRLVVHLLNATGLQSRPLTEVIPLSDISLEIRCEGTQVTPLYGDAQAGGRDGERLKINIPRLELFAAFAIT